MKTRIVNYTFDASEKKVTFTDINPILLDALLLVTNVTDNIIIYNFADSTCGGTVATNVLTLVYNTTLMSDTDDLQIFYDDDVVPATSVKQLVDNHQVTVSNQPTEFPLPAAQVVTLTPPAAIAGFATEVTLALIKAKTDNLDTALSGIKTGTDKIIAAPATSTKQDTLLTELQLKADLTETQPVSAASLPLPTGAATSTRQDTEIAYAKPPQGTASRETVTLTNINTWYAVPSSPPVNDYLLQVTFLVFAGTIMHSWEGGGTPGVATDAPAPNSYVKRMKGGTSLYYASTSAADKVKALIQELV